jgi:hydrocephalus-inducing protein
VSCLGDGDSITSLVTNNNNASLNGSANGSSVDSSSSNSGNVVKGTPREFDIVPATGTIAALSSIKVAVTLCSNTVRKYETALVVDVAGVGDELVSLPILAK